MTEEARPGLDSACPDDNDISLVYVLQVIARRKMLIVKICISAMVLSVCASLAMKNIYTATCKFFPPQKDSGAGSLATLLAQAGPLAGLGGLGGPSDIYLALIKSRTVADSVVKRLDLVKEYKSKNSEDARLALEKSVKFTLAKDGVITVAANSKDPKKAAEIANAFMDETIRRSVQLYMTKAGTERLFLEKKIETTKSELKNAEAELKKFQEQHKTIKADAQATVSIDAVARLRAELVSKEVQLAALRNSMTDESADVKALLAAIARLKGQLGALTSSGGSDSVIPSTGNVPSLAMEYIRKVREVKTQEAIFEQLSKQYEMAKINETKDSSSVQIIDEAVPPIKKSKPNRAMIVLSLTVLSFFLSILIILIQEFISNLSPGKLKELDEVKRALRFRA